MWLLQKPFRQSTACCLWPPAYLWEINQVLRAPPEALPSSAAAVQPWCLHQLKTYYAEVKIIAYEPALQPPIAAK